MNVILFGAPGVGKGTQSSFLIDKLDMRHISTGDLFRYAIKNKTTLGQEASRYMDEGKLVPDSIVIGMVEEVLEKLNGQNFILDGFPRTGTQAEALENLLKVFKLNIGKVISIKVPEDVLIGRLTGRRVCKGCGAVFHQEAKPTQEEGVCDSCGGDVVQRSDDKEDVIQQRLEEYENNTKPVKDFYEKQSKLVEVDGLGSAEEVFERIRQCIH
ncbi:MAG: adenylate kinase [Bdellovibrionaceae bacterium]|jgi:adenylate kinase|nr:adenylate kinase [Pseudobdellovibrionaceae bacterium]